MSQEKQPPKKSKLSLFHLEVVLWVAFFAYSLFHHTEMSISFLKAIPRNLLESLWNGILLWFCLHALLRLWVTPLWRLIVRDQTKLGSKLEWYDPSFRQLTPTTKNIFWPRFGIVLGLSFSIKVIMDISWFPSLYRWRLAFAPIPNLDPDSFRVRTILEGFWWLPGISWFALFSLTLWLALLVEGRTRIFAFGLTKRQEWKEKKRFLLPMPTHPYEMNSDALEMCLFSRIHDDGKEEWVKMDEKSLRGNILVIAPTGGGKTTALIRPFAQQAIAWQKENPKKKAAVIFYDPKAELTPEVEDMCQKAGRSDDLILLSEQGKATLNPIAIERPFAGETAWRVSGWIVSAWENAQGAVSSEPYWKNQNILLTRNLLILLYLEKGIGTTIADVSRTVSVTAGGCFENGQTGQKVSRFGIRVFVALMAAWDKTNPNAFPEDVLDLQTFNPIEASLITDEVRNRTKTRIEGAMMRFIQTRARFHLTTHDEVRRFLAEDSSEGDEKAMATVEKLVGEEFLKRWGSGDGFSFEEEVKTWIIMEGEKLREKFDALYAQDLEHVGYLQIIRDSCNWLLDSWSKIAEDNRGSVVSNMLPFLQKFETPTLERVFSPKDQTLSMRQVVTTGKIVVIDFPGNRIGDDLANGIVTLVKACWQEAVLACPRHEWSRPKVQVGEEYQRFMTTGKGGGSRGDGEFLELGRGFGNISLAVTQSVSALKVVCSRDVEFTKLFANMRTLVCLGTTDPETFQLMQNIAGKEVKQRLSQTVTENANDTELDLLNEKYRGNSDSLSISYTRNETLEERLQAEDLVEAPGYTAAAIVFDGRQNTIMRRIALRPHYWPDWYDSYELIQRSQFEPKFRSKFKTIVTPDPMRQLFLGEKSCAKSSV